MTSTDTIQAQRRHLVPEGVLTYEPSERWVRATVGGITVVDSKAPVLVWEPGRAVPGYVFPRRDVRVDLFAPAAAAEPRPGARDYFDLVLPESSARLEAIAWSYAVPELAEHIGIDWFRRPTPGIEHWYEEDEEIFVHPRDPYKRVDPLPSSRHVQVSINGVLVADTHRAVHLYETRLPTRYYVPAEDVRLEHFTPSPLQTRCPYKGIARYWSFSGNSGTSQPVDNVLWSYPEPIPAAEPVRDLLAFYNEVVDITVDGVALDRPATEFTRRLQKR